MKKVTKVNLIKDMSNEILTVEKFKNRLIREICENKLISESSKDTVVTLIMKEFSKFDNYELVKEVYEKLEKQIFENLSSITSADDNNAISIKLFEGIQIKGILQPEQTIQNNITGTEVMVDSRIKVKAHITKTYTQKVNETADI